VSNSSKSSKSQFVIVSSDEAKSEPYPYVYVNDDGSVRELHPSERLYLETSFSPFDGARPYTKDSYKMKDGWGSIAGYCHRAKLPVNMQIQEAPVEDPSEALKNAHLEKEVKFAKENGWEVIENPDGSTTMRRRKS
jgi:hypothetical protein